MIKNFLALLATLLILAESSYAADYVRAMIYYHDWNINVRVQMKPIDVRERYLTSLDIRDGRMVRELVDKLPLSDLRELETHIENQDVRLVIDFFLADGGVDTFYASKFRLFDSSGTHGVELEPSFGQGFALEAIVVDLQ
jgi:hypothetical protein